MYLIKTPSILQPLAKDLQWKGDDTDKNIYFTFDDGPTPGVTDQVLDLLQTHNAKGTFFCLGKNAEAHQDLFSRITDEGHSIGNHTYNHPDGWKTSTMSYIRNTLKARESITSNLFRPPYGRITPAQAAALKRKYRIVMWTLLSADFDQEISPEKCFQNVVNNIESGSIVVFHDSLKAKDNMLYALKESLQFLTEEGYIFRAL